MDNTKEPTVVELTRMDHAVGLELPEYATDLSAGVDLRAAIDDEHDLIIEPGSRVLVPTGLKIALPAGFEAQVRPRSGLAVKHGVTVLNSPGTIDADYRGEVKIGLINLGPEPYNIQRGDRIAQLIVAAIQRADLKVVAELDKTVRQAGGFGHTGK